MATVGIHLIWTTYGTWLPGDSRGHWSPLFDFYGHLIERGGKINRADLVTRERALELMKEPPKILDDDEIGVVSRTVGGLSIPGPRVYAGAIEPTHVHLLIGGVQENIGTVAGRLKGRTSSEVLKLPRNQARCRTWTAGYWKVFLFDEMAFHAVKVYIEAHNLRKGLPAVPYDWISPMDK